ncbi:MAG: lipoyl domain-containing protein [Sulfolobales archaeon]
MVLATIYVPRELWPRRGVWSGKIIDLKVNIGDKVSVGDPLVEIEIEKAVIVLESEYSGVVKEIYVKKGDLVGPGDKILLIEVFE